MGIRDKVVIIGMGCTRFGERWDMSPEALVADAYDEALADAGIEADRIGAAWLACANPDLGFGASGIPLSVALALPHIAVTRVENFCASGTEAFRGAVYAVASGAVDVALAVGVEKLKDTGFGGLPVTGLGTHERHVAPATSGPGAFAQLAVAYQAKYGIDGGDLKRAMARISVKSHANGARNPKAHLRNLITEEQVLNAPAIAGLLGLFDCCGVSDGAAAAIVTTPEVARALGKVDPVAVKAIQLVASNGSELEGDWDGAGLPTVRRAARQAYAEAGIADPRSDIGLAEVHDCFSITELVTMEDLGIVEDGGAVKAALDGHFDRDGAMPVQIDGGLKCFGHPVGASGLRMLYELYLQIGGRAGERQLANPRFGLSHNIGGEPFRNIAAVSILGPLD